MHADAFLPADCTPKAVSHRLTNIKKTGKPVAGGSAASSPVKKTAASTPKKTATPRAKAGAAKTKKTTSASTSASDSEENQPKGLLVEDDDSEEAATPSMARSKRNMSTLKRSYTESDQSSEDSEVEDEYMPMAKRVKTEPADEEASLFGGGAVQFGDGLDETEI